MATIVTGQSISVGDTVTAQTLHDMVENATLSGISGAGLGVLVSDTQADPDNTDFWYDTRDNRDRVIRVFDTASSLWLAFGPDRYEIALINNNSNTVFTGALVVHSGASAFDIATAPSINVLGFLQAATGPGAAGPVCPFGIGWAAWASSHSGGGDAHTAEATEHLIAHSTPAGKVGSIGTGNNTTSGPIFGMWLEDHWTGFTSSSEHAGRAMIWGCRLTETFA